MAMTTEQKNLTTDLLQEYGIQATESLIEQAEVFIKALQINAERNIRYADLWKRDGWLGCLHHAQRR